METGTHPLTPDQEKSQMKNPAVSILALLSVLSSVGPLSAQEVRQRRLDPATSLYMAEIGAIAQAQEDSEAITFGTLLSTSSRPQANRDIDVAKGDEVVMLNGQRVRSIQALRELYEGVEEGDEVKMALKRDGQPFLVSFAKSAEVGSGVVVRRRQVGGGGGEGVRIIRSGGGDVEVFHEARVILGEQDGEVRVINQLPGAGDLHEGDVVLTLDGKAVDSVAALREIYGALAVGDTLRLGLRRGEDRIEVGVTKAEKPAGMVIR